LPTSSCQSYTGRLLGVQGHNFGDKTTSILVLGQFGLIEDFGGANAGRHVVVDGGLDPGRDLGLLSWLEVPLLVAPLAAELDVLTVIPPLQLIDHAGLLERGPLRIPLEVVDVGIDAVVDSFRRGVARLETRVVLEEWFGSFVFIRVHIIIL